ncbi:MAG TPA: RcnB family protein [Steroidobacteraceae bacterium]|jgi:Ni/Co efflux regulator RcnB
MKRTIIGAMLLSLAVGSLALADPPQGYDQHHDEHHHAVEHHHPMAHHAPARFMTGRYVRPHGYHAHTWRRGERLPVGYRASAYVIPDAAVYHLRPAPRGYYWVRVDDNAVLAAVATGVVVDVSLNLFR